MADPVLSIRDLTVEFDTDDGIVHAVTDVSYDVYPGETLGIVGESGSGKSVSTMSLLGLIPRPPGRVASGTAIFGGQGPAEDEDEADLRQIRGGPISLIFQDPLTALNPVLKVGNQLREAIETHGTAQDGAATKRAIELLKTVGIPNAEQRYDQYPHEYRRHAAARDDRDGDRERAEGADRGRADDGARRHDPGADSRGAEEGT